MIKKVFKKNKIQPKEELKELNLDDVVASPIPEQEIQVPEETQDSTEAIDLNSQLVFTSKKAQKEHIKNMKESLSQEALIEKQRIEQERTRLKTTIMEIEAEIEKAKLRQTKTLEDAKFQEAKIIEEAIKQKQIEAVEMRKRQDLLKQRRKDISLIHQSHERKQILIKEEIAAKRADTEQKLKLARIQIKDELQAKKREARLKEDEQKQLAFELRSHLREERLRAQQDKAESKAKFHQEIAQMRLELFAEKERQRQELRAKRIAAKNLRMQELEKVREEESMLKHNKQKVQSELKISRIKSNLKVLLSKTKIDAEVAEHQMDAESIKQDNRDAIKSVKAANAAEVDALSKANDSLNKKIEIGSLTFEQLAARDQDAMKVFKEDYVTLVSDFKGFDKRGEKELERVKKPISEKKLRKYKEHPYYGPMVIQYIQLEQEGNFAGLLTMLLAAYIVAEERIYEELIIEKVKTLQKAVLQGIPIKIGPYYVMPIKKSGISSYYISHHLKDGEVIFDNNKLFSVAIMKALEEIIAYKLDFGTSIKIIDGLAIANDNGSLNVAVYPNIIR